MHFIIVINMRNNYEANHKTNKLVRGKKNMQKMHKTIKLESTGYSETKAACKSSFKRLANYTLYAARRTNTQRDSEPHNTFPAR